MVILKTLLRGKKVLDQTRKVQKTRKKVKRGLRILLFMIGFLTGAGAALGLVYLKRDALAAAVVQGSVPEAQKAHLLGKKHAGQ